jgi:hypothetical protein
MTTSDEMLRFNLTVDELLDIRRVITLLRAEWHNPGAARHITRSLSFDCDREVEDAIYRIDHVLECNAMKEANDVT